MVSIQRAQREWAKAGRPGMGSRSGQPQKPRRKRRDAHHVGTVFSWLLCVFSPRTYRAVDPERLHAATRITIKSRTPLAGGRLRGQQPRARQKPDEPRGTQTAHALHHMVNTLHVPLPLLCVTSNCAAVLSTCPASWNHGRGAQA